MIAGSFTLGSFSLDLAFALGVYAWLASLLGLMTGRRRLALSGRGAALGLVLAVVVASLWLWHLLFASDFRFQYVVSETDLTLPLLYKFAAFWGGFAGSLLLWVLLLALYLGVQLFFAPASREAALPAFTVVMLTVLLPFLGLLVTSASPFAPAPPGVLDGAGMNPLLQYPEMAIHPVLLYLGFTGMTVPFAWAMSHLLFGNAPEWTALTRRTTLVAWLFLTAGITLGAHWSYRVLGWGGYWAWDPVENASLLPWLTGTAYLHAAVMRDQRRAFAGVSAALVVVTFLLTLFGTVITRSGIVSSIHAFTDTDLWPYFLALLLGMTAASAAVLAVGWRRLGDRPVAAATFSRETLFVWNNVFLLGLTLSILWGTIYPLVSELVSGTTVTAGTRYFDTVFTPLGLVLVFLMGLAPHVAWRRGRAAATARALLPATAALLAVGIAVLLLGRSALAAGALALVAFSLVATATAYGRAVVARRRGGLGVVGAFGDLFRRQPRRFAGYLVHVGVLLVAVGIVGSQVLAASATRTLAVGGTAQLAGYHVRFDGMSPGTRGVAPATTAHLTVAGPFGGATLAPTLVLYPGEAAPTGQPAIWSSPFGDFYAVLSGTRGPRATFVFFVNPLTSWIWFGAAVAVLGTLLALRRRPGEEEAALAVRELEPAWRG